MAGISFGAFWGVASAVVERVVLGVRGYLGALVGFSSFNFLDIGINGCAIAIFTGHSLMSAVPLERGVVSAF